MTLSDWGSIGSIVALLVLILAALRRIASYIKLQWVEIDRAKDIFSSFGPEYEEGSGDINKRQDMALYILIWHQKLMVGDVKNSVTSYWILAGFLGMIFLSRDALLNPDFSDLYKLIEIGLVVAVVIADVFWFVNIVKFKRMIFGFESGLLVSLEKIIYRPKSMHAEGQV